MRFVVGVSVVALAVTSAHADVDATLRVGVLPLDLEPSASTPLFGDEIDRAVRSYNTAAAARDRQTGSRTEPIEASDLALEETLFVVAPGLELGERFFFRIEAVLGLGPSIRSYGAGIYPLNVRLALGKVDAYLSAGGTGGVLARSSSDDRGAIVTARAAAGIRYERLGIEVGYSAFALGGIVDESAIDELQERMPSRDELEAELPSPVGRVEAGESRGLVDVSVGVAF